MELTTLSFKHTSSARGGAKRHSTRSSRLTSNYRFRLRTSNCAEILQLERSQLVISEFWSALVGNKILKKLKPFYLNSTHN